MAQTALITGASSGIGKELAYLFANDGTDLVLVARSEDSLRQLAAEIATRYGRQARVVVQDLEHPDAPYRIYDQLQQANVQVDVLVNNAGFGTYGEFVDTNVQEEAGMIEVNIKALTVLTRLFLPDMIRRRQGGILNVASTAAFQPGPLMAVYYATKAYVLSFTEALQNECRNTGVTVNALCPGPTKTGFGERAKMGESKLLQNATMSAREVAEIGYRGFTQGKTIVIPGVPNQLLSVIVRFLPRATVTRLVRRVQDRR